MLGQERQGERPSLLSWLQALHLVTHPWAWLPAPSSGWLGPPVPLGHLLSFLVGVQGLNQGSRPSFGHVGGGSLPYPSPSRLWSLSLG